MLFVAGWRAGAGGGAPCGCGQCGSAHAGTVPDREVWHARVVVFGWISGGGSSKAGAFDGAPGAEHPVQGRPPTDDAHGDRACASDILAGMRMISWMNRRNSMLM